MKWYSYILLVVLFACQSAVAEPEDLISRDAMAELLADVHLADAAAEFQRLPTTEELFGAKNVFFNDVLKEHGFTEEEFQNSYEFYSADLEGFVALYDSVLVILSQREADIQ